MTAYVNQNLEHEDIAVNKLDARAIQSPELVLGVAQLDEGDVAGVTRHRHVSHPVVAQLDRRHAGQKAARGHLGLKGIH